MGVVAKPSLLILLVEDSLHKQFIYRYLKELGFGRHDVRVEESPSGQGIAEQWIRQRFPIEFEACRGRQAETRLIVLIDADKRTVQQRLAQL
jgi:hypothetical protein